MRAEKNPRTTFFPDAFSPQNGAIHFSFHQEEIRMLSHFPCSHAEHGNKGVVVHKNEDTLQQL